MRKLSHLFLIPPVVAALLAAASPSVARFGALEYRNVGPLRGGRVTAVAGTVQEPGTFYLGASGGGLWKSTDYGTSWVNVSDGYFATPSIGAIAVSQTDPNLLFVGTGSDGLRSNVITGRGVYKSVDAGASWQQVGLQEAGQIGAVEIDPGNNNVVWVAAIGQPFGASRERGVYRSGDGGQSWERVLSISDTVGFSDLELLPGNPEVVFATAWRAERKPWTIISGGSQEEGGLYKSVDGGNSWRRITTGLPGGLIGKMDLAISPADSRVVYVLVEAPGEEGGLYRSEDQGETFTLVSNEEGLRSRPFYYGNVEVDPTDADRVFVMATRYFRSEDGGRSWEKIASPHSDNHDMWINPRDPDLFIQANDGGANVTHNGGLTWSTQFNQPTAELYQVEVDDQYPYWLYAGMQDNYATIAVPSQAPRGVQHPAGWLLQTGGCETGPAVPKPGDHNTVYVNCKGRFGVFDKRTGTERSYWVGAANMYGHNPADLRFRFQRVSPVHVSPHDPGVVYHASQYVHVTRDEGLSWTIMSPDLTAFEADRQVVSGTPITRDITGEEFYSTIYSLRESPLTPGLIWAGANDGPVHVTRDGGASWEEVTPRGLPPGGRVDSVEPSPHDPGVAYIAVLRYQLGDYRPWIYRTDNYGKRWTLLSGRDSGIPADAPVRVVREDPVRRGLLYAGTESGVFVSFDEGRSWEPLQQNLPVTPVTDIRVHRGDLVLSTMGRGFWILDNVSVLRQAPLPELPAAVQLFAPDTALRYRPAAGDDDDDRGGVPSYPTPAAIIDYYLPEAAPDTLLLEILDADGSIVNSFTVAAQDAAQSAGDDQSPEMDMALNRPAAAALAHLPRDPGLNRFRWDMRHRGPWHEDADKRFTDGPLARPGVYTVRLTVGERVLEQPLTLRGDPRVSDLGVSDADIDAQVALQLEISALLGDARRLAQQLSSEQEQTDGREVERGGVVTEVLAALETAEGTYQQPMLIDQIEYLASMLAGADQRPGADAFERFEALRKRFEELQQLAGG